MINMTALREIYHCGECGNAVEVESAGAGQMSCCGQLMKLMKANSADAAAEKHVPVIEKHAEGVVVKVGTIAHPSEEKHHIAYIEICAAGIIMKKYLKPGDAPETFFRTDAKDIRAWAYCNLHGLWTSS